MYEGQSSSLHPSFYFLRAMIFGSNPIEHLPLLEFQKEAVSKEVDDFWYILEMSYFSEAQLCNLFIMFQVAFGLQSNGRLMICDEMGMHDSQ